MIYRANSPAFWNSSISKRSQSKFKHYFFCLMISTVRIDEKEFEKASGLALNCFSGPLVHLFSNVNSAIWGGPVPMDP